MGPYNLHTQLERKANVLNVLKSNDLSEWARNYWGNVYDTIAMEEGRYNERVKSIYSTLKPKHRGWATYE